MQTSTTRIPRLLGIGAIGAIAATVVNSVLYGLGRAANISYLVAQTGHAPDRVRLVHVVSLSLMSFAIGLAIASIATALRRPSLRVLQVVGAVIGLASIEMDFTVHASAGTRATLACMHVIAGIAYVASLQIVRSPRVGTSRSAQTVTKPIDAMAA